MSARAGRHRLLLAGLLAGLLVVVGAPAGVAVAAARATAGPGPAVVTSGTYAAAPRTADHQAAAPLVLVWGQSSPDTQLFDVVNTGTLELVGSTWTVESTSAGRGAPKLSMDACVGGRWEERTCTGTEQALGTWRVGEPYALAAAPTPAAPGASVHVRATLTGGSLRAGEQVTASVSVAVGSGPDRQLRAATVVSGGAARTRRRRPPDRVGAFGKRSAVRGLAVGQAQQAEVVVDVHRAQQRLVRLAGPGELGLELLDAGPQPSHLGGQAQVGADADVTEKSLGHGGVSSS